MKKSMKRALEVAAITGVGVGALMMYKKKNPAMVSSMKSATKNTLRKTADMLDDSADDM